MAIALAGRPNVGKSSLFNKLIGKRRALVWDRPGVTRDVLHAKWKTSRGDELDLWDMAGWDRFGISLKNVDPNMIKEIELIIVVVDGSEPLTSEDREGFKTLRKLQKPMIVALNKCDKRTFETYSHEIFEEFQGKVFNISAEKNIGLTDLEDHCIELIQPKTPEIEEPLPENAKRVLVLGRPNVGKSSLMNQLAGRTVALVSNIAGTTRDTVEFRVKRFGLTFAFKDSAGVRKKGNIYGRKADPVEIFSTQMALNEIDRSDFVIFVIEANQGTILNAQDKKLLHLIRASLIPTVVLVNKWDLFKKEKTEKEYRDELKYLLGDLNFLPILFVSAKTGFHIDKIYQLLRDMGRHLKRYSTSKVNEWLQDTLKLKAPRVAKKGVEKLHGGKTQTQYLNMTYALQTGTRPMTFQIFCNAPHAVADEDKKFLERRLRDHFQLQGIPVKLVFRKKA